LDLGIGETPNTVEAVDLGDLAALVVSPEQGNTVRVATREEGEERERRGKREGMRGKREGVGLLYQMDKQVGGQGQGQGQGTGKG